MASDRKIEEWVERILYAMEGQRRATESTDMSRGLHDIADAIRGRQGP